MTDFEHIIRPRLSDAFDLAIPQDSVSFAIPYLREDRPFCLDPFLLWNSDKPEYRALHADIEQYLELVRELSATGQEVRAMMLLSGNHEARELGLGYGSGTQDGNSIGPELARRTVLTFKGIPQLVSQGMTHLETIGLLVPGIAEDRLSDLTAGLIGRWLIEFTQEQCQDNGIPMREGSLAAIWSPTHAAWRSFTGLLPWNPVTGRAVLLAPLDLLRKLPWINFEDYYKNDFSRVLMSDGKRKKAAKEAVLAFNRENYERVQGYIRRKEEEGVSNALPHPLFEPLKRETIRRKLAEIKKLNTGVAGGADKRYEQLAYDVLSSLLWPELDLAAKHSRTDSGAHIVDVIFHNDGRNEFLRDIRERHSARQLIWELKNVERLNTENVNQLYRYLDSAETGNVGILLTRNPAPSNVIRNTVELHSSKRFFVLCADDRDLELMFSLAESGRRPIEALRKLYVEFTRRLPR